MRVSWAGRVAGLALACVILALAGAGCVPRTPEPDKAEAALKKAHTLDKAGEIPTAMAQYAQAAQYDSQGPTAPEAYVEWARLALKNGHPEQAIQAYTGLQGYPRRAVVKTPDGETVRVPQDVEDRLDAAMKAQDQVNSSKVTYKLMDFLVRLTGKHPAFSYWIAIFIFTGALKLIITPMTISQLKSSRKMMIVQPRLKEIQDKYRDRPDELNRRMMALYKEEGVNPLGCGSGMIIQMAIIFMLYKVILDYRYQFRNGQFLWIGSSLSQHFPAIFAPSLAKPDVPLLIIYSISMFVQSRMTIVPSMDPQQAQQQKMMASMMPIMLLVVLRTYPSAFALYWLLFNVLTTIQQLHINKELDSQRDRGGGGSETDDDADDGGSKPKKPFSPSPKKGPGRNLRKSNGRSAYRGRRD